MSRGSVQTVYMDLVEIDDDVARLAGGQARAVLEVGSLNFGLLGEREREAILAGFAAFLNGLNFPVQILVRVLPIDVERYLAELERRTRQLPASLAELARDHVAFLRKLARNRTLLERRFYLVVPAEAPPSVMRRWPLGRRTVAPDPDALRRQLTFRCGEVARQLARCGLTARRLPGGEIAQLVYACWNPELARAQRLERGLNGQTPPVVTATHASPRRP